MNATGTTTRAAEAAAGGAIVCSITNYSIAVMSNNQYITQAHSGQNIPHNMSHNTSLHAHAGLLPARRVMQHVPLSCDTIGKRSRFAFEGETISQTNQAQTKLQKVSANVQKPLDCMTSVLAQHVAKATARVFAAKTSVKASCSRMFKWFFFPLPNRLIVGLSRTTN